MIVVEAMPDELSAAHAGRFGSLNRLQSRQVHLALRSALTADGHEVEGLPMVELLALATGMSSIAYAQAHSMIPVLRVATKGDVIRPHGHRGDRSYTKRLGTTAPREGGFVCLKCLKLDLETFGFSWFRRAHHLIGVDWCIHHHESLWQVDSTDPFIALPHVWKARNQLRELDACARSLDEADPFIQRYVAIVSSFLTLVQPIPTIQLHPPIRERATALGLRRAMVGKQPPLSDRVRDLATKQWLQAHVPGLYEKPDSEFSSRIDTQLFSLVPVRGDSYALALAALYPSADDAIAAVRASCQHLPRTELADHATHGMQFWQGEAWQHYARHRGDHRELAENIGLPVDYVSSHLLNLGLPDLKEIGYGPLGAALNSFVGGESIEQACADHAVDVQDLQALLRVTCVRPVKVIEQMTRVSGRQRLHRYKSMTLPGTVNFSSRDNSGIANCAADLTCT